jgi:putrescine transport system permease protein
MRAGDDGRGRRLAVGLPFLWLGAFFLVPFLIVLRMAFSESAQARPPYRPVFESIGGWRDFVDRIAVFGLDNFRLIFEEPLYGEAFFTSVRLAASATIFLILIGYPMAYAMARAPGRLRPLLVALVILPFWTSFLIRVYAWIGILKPEGLLNLLLMKFSLITEPLEILNTEIAVQIGLVYAYMPFMVLPLYAALERIDPALTEAAMDLGAPRWKAFWLVTVPLSMPGVLAGSFLVFIPALGEFVIPDLLGGSDTIMLGRSLWVEFFNNRDWPLASAVAVLLLAIVLGPMAAWAALERRGEDAEARTSAARRR